MLVAGTVVAVVVTFLYTCLLLASAIVKEHKLTSPDRVEF